MINVYKFHPKLFTPNREVEIFVFADTHIGNPYANLEKLQRNIDTCKRRGAYWVHLGDWCEIIDATDIRYNNNNEFGLSLPLQYYTAIKMFEPIKDQCLGILCGNHDRPKQSTSDYAEAIAKALQVPYLGYRGFITLGLTNHTKNFEKKQADHRFVMFLWHGSGGGITIGSKANKISRLSRDYGADVYLMGHHHTPLSYYDEYTTPGKQHSQKYKIQKKLRHYVVAPGYLEPPGPDFPETDYTGRKGITGQRTGYAKLTLRLYQPLLFTEQLEERYPHLRPSEIRQGLKTPKKKQKQKRGPFEILVKPEFITNEEDELP